MTNSASGETVDAADLKSAVIDHDVLVQVQRCAPSFIEPCTRCRATGFRWITTDGVRTSFMCSPCGGTGERTYAASKEQRAHKNAMAKARKERKLAEAVTTFKTEYPAVWAWMERGGFEFAVKMRESLGKYGSLTDRQMVASLRCVRRDT